MGTITVSTIISDARGILQDNDSNDYTWSAADLIRYINDGQRNIILLKPDAYITSAAVQLAAGTKQTVADGIGLVKLTRFMGSDGSTPGRVINFVPWEQMNYIDTDWHAASTSATPEIYTYDQDDPTHFYVYPPQPSSGMGYVEEVYKAIPSIIDETTDTLSLNDIYYSAVLNYVLYRAYQRENDAISDSLSQKYYNLYVTEIGRKDLADAKSNPSHKG